jgi:four helix bundle protein
MTKQKTISQKLAEKTMRELAKPKQPKARSRVWKSPQAYHYLVQWSNAVLLRYFIKLFTAFLPKAEYRRKAQVDDAARSVVRNIEEGWKRANTSDYLNFIGYSQGSLEEVKGDIRELTEDGFLKTVRGSSLKGIGVDLGEFNQALKPGGYIKDIRGQLKEKLGENKASGFDYIPLTVLYPPLKKIRSEDLTYEMFMELINKTDWLLRRLVESLEKKLADGQKGYQVEKASIRSSLKES